MAFCHNCGTPHTDGDRFCPSCGTELYAAQSKSGAESSVADKLLGAVDQTSKSCDPGREVLQGVIMTNVKRLAKRFNESVDGMTTLLNCYIELVGKMGVDYKLLDLSDKGCGDSWIAHSRELTLMHAAHFRGVNRPIFLFIIGGDDIIPMPTLDNMYYHARSAAGDGNYHDKDVDTDLPYAYLLGEHTQGLIYKGELFNHTPNFCVGRLPFDQKSSCEVLVEYLKRAIVCHKNGGVTIESGYAQTNRDWSTESYITSSVMNERELLPAYSSKYTDEFTFNNLLTSPGVVVENVQSVFNTSAELLFFNMHGSDNPTNPNFMGHTISFSPSQLATLTNPNIVVTEACYGAKFKNLDASYSMLLSAMKSATVVYFGSSRIALGGGGYEYERVEDLVSADLYFRYLLDALTLSGYPVGYSVEYARAHYIKALRRIELKDLLTIAEFNLYGDPTIRSQMRGKSAAKCEPPQTMTEMKLAPLAEGKGECGFTIDKRYEREGGSLLSMIRNQVDASLKQVVDSLNRELYERHGIEPRDLSTIVEVKYKDKSRVMEFVYNRREEEIDKIYVVQLEDGVSRVLISK